MSPQVSVTIGFTDVVAFWGAITGSISITIAFLAYWRDRRQIKVDIRKDWMVVGHPDYDPNKLYLSVDVLNVGRRPATITKTGYVFLRKRGGAILADSMRKGAVEITEGKNTSSIVEQENLDLDEISYFAAYDAVGNTYKKRVAPFYLHFFYWFLDKSGVRKKPPARG